MSSRRQEDLSQNRFLQVLRASFEGIYRQAAQRGDRTVILVPCAECLEAEHFGQSFVETHLLQASPMPGCFMNHLGQGVEIKENSVATQLGFQEHRLCEVLQKDSMYDLSNTFKVLVIDKPLIGRFKPLSAAVPEPGSAGNLDDLLLHSPSIQGEFFDEVDRFRKTFVQVPGCENRTAERIREIVTEAVDKLSRQHKVTSASQVAQLEFKVSRQAYTALYSFIFPHLQSLLTEKEDQLQRSVRSYASPDDLLKAVPGGERLCFVDVTESAAELELLEGKIAPHEKIECVDKAHALLQKSIASLAPERSSTPMEITGDDVLSLFILVVYRSQVKNFLAHVCHMEMYLQGPSRSGGGARFEEAGYAVSALQAGLQFFMEEERPVAPTGPSIRQKEAEAKAEKERKKAEAVAKHTGKKASQRAARRQKRLKEGKMQQSDKDLEELLQTKDEVVCALEDVQDEAELRKKFPSEGTAGYGSEYFSSSRYKFRYLLSKDGTPVAQIYKWPWP